MNLFFRNWYKQKNPQDHIPAVIANLLQLLRIPATLLKIRETLKTHPDYPSLLSVTESLWEWGISAEALKGTIGDLSSADYPGIAYLKSNRFVVVEKIDRDMIYYIDPAKGRLSSTLDLFGKIWSGVILRVRLEHEGGERNFHTNRRHEVTKAFRNFFTLPGLILLGILILTDGLKGVENAGIFPTLWGAKLVGAILCLVMFLSSITESQVLKKVCSVGKRVNCLQVLNSPAGKIFGISMAELGLVYFLGGLLAINFMLYTGDAELNLFLLAILNVLTLPYTLFSLVYQAFVIRSWCWMCVAVQVLFWVEFYLLSNSIHIEFDGLGWTPLLPAVLGFSLSLLSWAGLRSTLTNASKATLSEQELLRYRRNPDLIRMQLVNGQKVDIGQFAQEVYIGPENAPIILTLVANPVCRPCYKTYKKLNRLIQFGNGHIKGCIRFLVSKAKNGESSNEKFLDHEVSVSIISMSLAGDSDGVRNDLGEWFSQNETYTKNKLKKWLDKHANQNQSKRKEAEEYLQLHNKWAGRVSIKETPTVILNGIKLPARIQIEDLKYFLLRQIKND